MRVLLPTDFSKNAWHAISCAVDFFQSIPCEFYVLHAHQVSPSGLVSTINKERDTRLHQITEDEVKGKLSKVLDDLNRINKVKDHSFRGLLESDSLLNAIGRNVVDEDVDYIFMGTQGASGFKEVFMGSNAVSVMKSIDFCPIIMVPEAYDKGMPDQLVFATDYKHHYSLAELQPLLDLLKLWDATLHILHVWEEEKLNDDQLRSKVALQELVKDFQYTSDAAAYHPNLSYRIAEQAEDLNAGMIAMINSKHGFFRSLLREKVVKKIAFRSSIPFLVLPEIQ